MKKLEINKKTIIILAAIAVLIIAVAIGVTMCGKKEQEGSDKNKSEKDNVKTEQNDDKDNENDIGNDTVDQEGGLQIMGPEEADKQEDTNKVEFVNPNGSSNGTTDGENPSGEGEKEDKEDKEDKEENPGKVDDDEEIKYGEIY